MRTTQDQDQPHRGVCGGRPRKIMTTDPAKVAKPLSRVGQRLWAAGDSNPEPVEPKEREGSASMPARGRKADALLSRLCQLS